jgi:DNA invertase Pin-like site-specific DNA recombinase
MTGRHTLEDRLGPLSLESRTRLAFAQSLRAKAAERTLVSRQETDRLREVLIKLRRDGVSPKTIGLALGMSRSWVTRFAREQVVRPRTYPSTTHP